MPTQTPMPDYDSIAMIWFDMGNVLFPFSRQRQATALASLPACQLTLPEIVELIDSQDQTHLAYETGHLDRESFLVQLSQRLGVTASIDEVEDAYSQLFSVNQPVCQLAAELAERLPIGLATNTDPSHLAWLERECSQVMGLFPADRRVASCDCHVRKPQAEFFQCLIGRAGLPADRLLLIDDLLQNIAGARACGLQAIHFTGDVEVLRSLVTR